MKSRLAAFFVLSFLLLAAPAGVAADLVPSDDTSASAAGYGRAFGRVALIVDGKAVEMGTFVNAINLRLRSLATDQTQIIGIKGDGRFDWPMKPGEYVLQSFWHLGETVRLWATFSVPEAGKAAYLGDLAILAQQRRYLIGIEDRFEESVQAAAARHAELKMEPVKALMQIEKEPGTFRRVSHICAKEWGLECTRNLQGVEATLPDGTPNSYPSIASRAPLFEWKPSPAEGVTYDLALYDAFVMLTLAGERERGKLVLYAEGLREPRFQIREPLLADRRYMWSIRLRKGDTVSTWTTTGYAAFFVIGYAIASGQWYGFRTPER